MRDLFNRLKNQMVSLDLVNGKTLSGKVLSSEQGAIELQVTSADPATKEPFQEAIIVNHAVIGIARRLRG